MDFTILQHYWFIIIALLGALLVFLLFVQGGQTLIKQLGKTEQETTMLVNTFGRKWEFTFTTLVTFGGAFFASFPLFYSTSFGGAYWVWFIILVAFVVQAVSYEYRSKSQNLLGKKGFDALLFFNGLIAPVFLGTAVATFFTGSPFHISNMNMSYWDNSLHGLELAIDFTRFETFINLSLGLAVFFLSRVLGNLYVFNTINHDEIVKRARKSLLINSLPFLFFFLFFLVSILLIDGFALNPQTKEVFMEPYKYLNNLVEMPLVATLFLLGVVLVLWGIIRAYFNTAKCATKAIWFTGVGTVLVVMNLFFVAGFNNTAFYPSFTDIQSSLTIYNASSSKYTLVAMSYVSLMVPFVLAYIWYAWKSINNKRIDQQEMDSESHVY
ncbi:MAG: cytochrome d ubiquinol oxidase subunit II [Bacteroidales bacterium]|nr:cytochrome d ubiquinol oxidase subunit II [Bacteroidales bacterium]